MQKKPFFEPISSWGATIFSPSSPLLLVCFVVLAAFASDGRKQEHIQTLQLVRFIVFSALLFFMKRGVTPPLSFSLHFWCAALRGILAAGA